MDPQTPKEEVLSRKGSLLPTSNEVIQETFIEIQCLARYGLLHSAQDLPSRKQYICEGQREPDKNLSGSQHAPGQGQEADNVCLGSCPREGRLAGIQKYVCTGVEKQEGGEQAGGTMEQLKSKRRKHQWYPFRQRTCTSIQNKVKPERKSKTTTSFHLSSPLYFKCPLAI